MFQSLIGNVYKNWVTGTEWKLVEVDDEYRRLTFQDKAGNRFKTIPEMTINYEFIGLNFTKNKK